MGEVTVSVQTNFDSDAIAIFFASDDKFAPFVSICANSILLHTKHHIDFFVLDGGISTIRKSEILKDLPANDNFSIRFIDMTPYKLGRFPKKHIFSANTFSKFFVPNIAADFNNTLKKALYLDLDIIVRSDIAELYDQDLKERPLGAVREDYCSYGISNIRKKVKPDFQGDLYFNAGVLLYDIELWNKNQLTQKIVNLALEIGEMEFSGDQGVFNVFFNGNFTPLDFKFNFMPSLVSELIVKFPKEGENASKNPVVVHFAGERPWRVENMAFSKDFWDLAENTVWGRNLKKIHTTNIQILGLPIIKIIRSLFWTTCKICGFTLFKVNRTNDISRVYLFGLLKIMRISQKSK